MTYTSRTRSRGSRRSTKHIENPYGMGGTTEGKLFQINLQIQEKESDVSRVQGEIVYLRGKRKKLESELLYKRRQKTGKK